MNSRILTRVGSRAKTDDKVSYLATNLNPDDTVSVTKEEINSVNVLLLSTLSDNADRDDCTYVRRTMEEWVQGVCRFDRSGEILLGCFENGRCVAIGGVCQDPYINDSSVGRLRRVYVSSEERGKGIGKFLVSEIVDHAKRHFTKIRLNTRNVIASHLYESLGFEVRVEEHSTHTLIEYKSSIQSTPL